MNNDLPIVGILPGGKDQIRNVGIARITGAQLTAAGYKINWLYHITDIGVLATYENQGRDCWLGADGRPVAGTSAVFATLGPAFEGQRFYNITTQTPLQFKGGAWGGTTWASYQATSPTSIEATAGTVIEPERKYYVLEDNVHLQLAAGGRWLDGHTFNIKVTPGVIGGTIEGLNGTVFVTVSSPAGEDTTDLVEGQEYEGIYVGGVVYLFTDTESAFLRKQNNLSELTDKSVARSNLEVLSAVQVINLINSVTSDVGSGLIFEGGVESELSPRRARVDFATPQEVVAGVTGKVVGANTLTAVLQQVADNALSTSPYVALTGVEVTNANFAVTALNATTIEYTACSAVFNQDPALLTVPVTTVQVAAGSIILPTAAGWMLYDLIVDTAGTVSLSSSRVTTANYCRLAYVLALDSEIFALKVSPQVVTTDSVLRNQRLSFDGGSVTPSVVAPGSLTAGALLSSYEAINWVAKVPDLHVRAIAAENAIAFNYATPAGCGPAQVVVDGRKLISGAATAGQFTAQRLLRTMTGGYLLVPTAVAYASKAAALAAIPSIPALDITAFKVFAREVAWIILRGDQYAGSAALDLLDSAKCEVQQIVTSSGSASVGEQGASNDIIITAAGNLEPNKNYLLATNGVVVLPPATTPGVWVGIKVAAGYTPTVRAFGSDVIRDVTDNTTDTEVYYDVPPESQDRYTVINNEWSY